MNKETKKEILRRLEETWPEARAELHFSNPYETLVATILSAQCTDRQVNRVTPAVFARYPDAESMAAAEVEDLYPMVKSCGFKSKAGNIIGACRIIRDEYGGKSAVGFIYSGGTPLTEEYVIEDENSEYNNKKWIKFASDSETAGLNEIFDAVSKVFTGKGSLSTSATHSSNTPEAPGKAYHLTKFAQHEVLFLGVGLLGDLEDDTIQGMDDVYSVVPCPMVSAYQEYNSIIDNTGDAGAVNVKSNPRKVRALSAYIQYCTEHSKHIRSQFLEIVMKYKIATYDQGTDRMLDIIYNGILYGRDKAVDDLFGVRDRNNRWHDLMKHEHHEGGASYITTKYAAVVSQKQKALDEYLKTWYTLPTSN